MFKFSPLSLALCFFSVLFSLNISAQELKGKMGIGGGLGLNFPDKTKYFENNYEEDMYYQLHLKYHYNEQIASLLEISHETFDENNSTLTLNSFQTIIGGAQYRFGNTNSKFYSALKFGLGATNIKDSQDNKFRFTAKTGISLGYFLTSSLVAGIAADYKFIDAYSTNNTEYKTFTPMLEITYYFGAKDLSQKIKETVSSKVDGDDDQDGVLDSKDLCPDTNEGKKVNDVGCEIKLELQINILFKSGSNEITENYRSEINKVAEMMKQDKSSKVMIEGHTDSTGSALKNKDLSLKRAEAVKKYLIEKLGADATRITAMGYGSEKSVSSNSNPEGRAKNRRVIATFME